MWDTVKHDLKKESNDSQPMGKRYYDQLRTKFMADDAPERLLVPKDDSEEVDERLLEAMTAMMKHRRSFAELLAWCEVVEHVNQKCYVALCRQILKLSPSANAEACDCVVSVMKMVVRLKLKEKYPAETLHVQGQFDKACLRTIDTFKRNDQSTQVWWRASRAWACLVLPTEDTDRIVGEQKDWGDVEEHLHRVCDSSECGRRLFGKALQSLDMTRTTKKVQEIVGKLAGQPLNAAVLEANKAAFIKTMKANGVDPSKSFAKKKVDVYYRGVKCVVPVASIWEEYTLKVQAAVRTAAVDKGVVESLWSEDDLVGKRPVPSFAVDADVVAPTALARKTLNEALDSSEASAENIKRVISSKFGFLSSADKYFRIEQSFWLGFMGAPGAERLQAKILECLPGEGRNLSIGQSDSLLKKLADSKLLQFCGSGLQAIFGSIHGMVSAMAHGRAPNLAVVTDSPFVLRVKEALSLFCVYNPSDGSDAPAEEQRLFGAAAAVKQLEDLKAKSAAKHDLSLVDLRPLQIFTWLLSEAQQGELKAIMGATVAKLGRISQTNDGAEKTTKRGGGRKSADQAKQRAAALFT